MLAAVPTRTSRGGEPLRELS